MAVRHLAHRGHPVARVGSAGDDDARPGLLRRVRVIAHEDLLRAGRLVGALLAAPRVVVRPHGGQHVEGGHGVDVGRCGGGARGHHGPGVDRRGLRDGGRIRPGSDRRRRRPTAGQQHQEPCRDRGPVQAPQPLARGPAGKPRERHLHEPVGEPGEQEGRRQDHGGEPQAHGLPVEELQGEDEQRPVPQIEGVRVVSHPGEHPTGEQSGGGPGSVGRAALGPARREHECETGQRPQRPRAREQLRAVEHQPAGDDQQHAQPPGRAADRTRQGQPRAEEGEQSAEGQLPQARPRGQIRLRLVDGSQIEGVGEGPRQDEARQHGHHRCGGPPQPSGDPDGEQRHQRPDQIELPLHGEGPEVLERRGLRSGGAVGELGRDQLEVLVVEQGCAGLSPQLGVPGEGQGEQTQRRRRGHDESRRREDAAGEAAEVAPRVDPPAPLGGLAQEHAREQEAADREEQVDAAGDAAVAEEVEQHDAEDRQAP